MATLGDLTFNPQTNTWEQQQSFDSIQNQWAWDPTGLQKLGGTSEYSLTDPFLSVGEQYRGGAPINAATWQDAVRQSLTGFMRTNYGHDPLFNWDNTQSGNAGSQYQIGTLQELANKLPSFYNTSGMTRNIQTGQIGFGHDGANYDPLLGLNPEDKLLAFEDVPLEQIEKIVGGLPGQFFNQKIAAPYQQISNESTQQRQQLAAQVEELKKKLYTSTPQSTFMQWGNEPASVSYGNNMTADPAIQQQIDALEQQRIAADKRGEDARNWITQNAFQTLDQARASGIDYNDFLFKLNINPYTPPPEMIKASPQSVLQKFFDTPEYRLLYGNDPNVLNPNNSPTDRFRFDPGYQFSQNEGFRQMQNNAAAQGLLESGSTQRDLQGYAQGLADQNYQRWLQQNSGLFNQWQQGMAGLAQMGPQVNGANQANQLGQNLGQASMQGGSQAAQLLQQLGMGGMQSLGSLGQAGLGAFGNLGQAGLNAFGNLGTTGLNSLTQAGIAQGNNMTQASIANAQMQQQSQAGMGQMAGQLLGAFF